MIVEYINNNTYYYIRKLFKVNFQVTGWLSLKAEFYPIPVVVARTLGTIGFLSGTRFSEGFQTKCDISFSVCCMTCCVSQLSMCYFYTTYLVLEVIHCLCSSNVVTDNIIGYCHTITLSFSLPRTSSCLRVFPALARFVVFITCVLGYLIYIYLYIYIYIYNIYIYIYIYTCTYMCDKGQCCFLFYRFCSVSILFAHLRLEGV